MATQSSIPAWRIPWTEEPGGLQVRGGHRRVRRGWTHLHTFNWQKYLLNPKEQHSPGTTTLLLTRSVFARVWKEYGWM